MSPRLEENNPEFQSEVNLLNPSDAEASQSNPNHRRFSHSLALERIGEQLVTMEEIVPSEIKVVSQLTVPSARLTLS